MLRFSTGEIHESSLRTIGMFSMIIQFNGVIYAEVGILRLLIFGPPSKHKAAII